MNTLNRYIAFRTFRSILIAFLVVASIIMLVDFVEATRNIDADEDMSATRLFTMTALKAPILIEQTIPFVVLFGVMGALHALNRRSELIVLRASGLSAWRFLLPVMVVCALIGIVWATVFNPMAVRAMDRYETLSSGSQSMTDLTQPGEEIWLREGSEFEQTVIYAASFDPVNRTLYDVEFNIFEANGAGELVFSRRFDAEKAVLLPSSYWQLSNVVENTSDAFTEVQTAVSWPTQITLEDLQQITGQSASPPFWELPGEISRLDQAGFSTIDMRMQFHRLMALPLILIAMALIAATASMNLTREGGTLRLLMIGSAVGFGVFFIENIIKAFGETGAISVGLSVWIVPILVLFFGIIHLSRIEDG